MFINKKSYCELGNDLHVVTCWLDMMLDFCFVFRELMFELVLKIYAIYKSAWNYFSSSL